MLNKLFVFVFLYFPLSWSSIFLRSVAFFIKTNFSFSCHRNHTELLYQYLQYILIAFYLNTNWHFLKMCTCIYIYQGQLDQQNSRRHSLCNQGNLCRLVHCFLYRLDQDRYHIYSLLQRITCTWRNRWLFSN